METCPMMTLKRCGRCIDRFLVGNLGVAVYAAVAGVR